MRLDQYMTLKGLAPSRSKAKELIESGVVSVRLPHKDWSIEVSPSYLLSGEVEVRIEDPTLLKYVSRGGLKLEGALRDFNISVKGVRAFDIGQSTGGFTDCLLQHGASSVLGLDVGHGQLHSKLADDPRVQAYEGLHISEISNHKDVLDWLSEGFALAVIDVSFISIKSVFEALQKTPNQSFDVLGLMKPQFEVGKRHLSKGGIVRDQKAIEESMVEIRAELLRLGFETLAMTPSSLKGGDGNQEYWLHCRRMSI